VVAATLAVVNKGNTLGRARREGEKVVKTVSEPRSVRNGGEHRGGKKRESDGGPWVQTLAIQTGGTFLCGDFVRGICLKMGGSTSKSGGEGTSFLGKKSSKILRLWA